LYSSLSTSCRNLKRKAENIRIIILAGQRRHSPFYNKSGASRFLSLAIISTWSPLTATSEASSSATVGSWGAGVAAAAAAVPDAEDVEKEEEATAASGVRTRKPCFNAWYARDWARVMAAKTFSQLSCAKGHLPAIALFENYSKLH
jgi:hypothetical protein